MKGHTLIYIFTNSWKEFIQKFTYFPIYSSFLSKRASKLINILCDLSWMIHSTSSRESQPKHPLHTFNLLSRSACNRDLRGYLCLTWLSLSWKYNLRPHYVISRNSYALSLHTTTTPHEELHWWTRKNISFIKKIVIKKITKCFIPTFSDSVISIIISLYWFEQIFEQSILLIFCEKPISDSLFKKVHRITIILDNMSATTPSRHFLKPTFWVLLSPCQGTEIEIWSIIIFLKSYEYCR